MAAPLPLDDDLAGVTLLSIPDVAALWAISRATVYAMVKRGELRTIRVGSDMRIPLTELRAWIHRHSLLDDHPRVRRIGRSGRLPHI